MSKSLPFAASYFAVVLIILQTSVYILPSCITDTYVWVSCIFTGIVFAYYVYPWFKRRYMSEKVSSHNKAVIITGCDTGFGHELAKRLYSAGYLVFAGCLFPEGDGAKKLKKSGSQSIRVLELDVTKDESVANAVSYLKSNLGNSELWAVVNNAGILQGTEVALTKLESFESNLKVNTVGVVRVTKAFLPLLRVNKGRIIITASIAGRMALPYSTAYSMSKFATVAFSECLRSEMKPWGVKVITVEPEGFKTNIVSFENLQRSMKENFADVDEETVADYGQKYFQDYEILVKRLLSLPSDKIYKVVDAMEDAISLKEPSNFYRPARNVFASCFHNLLIASPQVIQELFFRAWVYFNNYPEPRGLQNYY